MSRPSSAYFHIFNNVLCVRFTNINALLCTFTSEQAFSWWPIDTARCSTSSNDRAGFFEHDFWIKLSPSRCRRKIALMTNWFSMKRVWVCKTTMILAPGSMSYRLTVCRWVQHFVPYFYLAKDLVADRYRIAQYFCDD